MNDWSSHLLDSERHFKKAQDYLRASQSLGPTARAIAMVNAETKLLEGISCARDAVAAVRQMQGPR